MRPRSLFWIGYVLAMTGLVMIHPGVALFVSGVVCMFYAWCVRITDEDFL